MKITKNLLIFAFHSVSWFKGQKRNVTDDCYGVDVSRNFDYNWSKKGTSSDECSEFYAGPYALSEPEVKLLSNFLMDSEHDIKMVVSIGGYGAKLSFPSDNMSREKVDEARNVAFAALRSVQSPKSNVIKYRIDSVKKKSGSIDAFAVNKANVRYSYTLEARDDPIYGFFVPAFMIEENANEIFDIVIGLAKNSIE